MSARNVLWLLLAATALAGCASVKAYWPWHAAPAAAPVAVHELDVVVPSDAAMPVVLQFWERNTLVVDLQGVPSSGELRLKPRQGGWPIRVAVRAPAGHFEVIEVRGSQRLLLPIEAAAGSEVTRELPPSLFSPPPADLQLRWGPAAGF